jgi:hypothetical protein
LVCLSGSQSVDVVFLKSFVISVIQFKIQLQGDDCDPIDRFYTPHVSSCPKTGHGFPTSYVEVFVVFNNLKWEVVVCFVDHHCLHFLLIRYYFLCSSFKFSVLCFLFCWSSSCALCKLILPVCLNSPFLIVPSVFSSVYIKEPYFAEHKLFWHM